MSAVENDLQNILDRLEALAIGRNEETKEIADKINTLAANIQRLTEKRDATSSPNATERDAESQPSTSGIDASSNPNASERDAVSSPGTSERDAAGISESNPCGCDVTLAAARSEDEVWRPDETPAEDCLDRHMANKTGRT